MDIFSLSDYREVLKCKLDENKASRGYQKRLAEAAQCHTSFISQVLRSHVQLTPDQAAGLCHFWGFNEDESDFFLALLNLSRSSSPHLKKMMQHKIESIRLRQRDLVNRINKTLVLGIEQQVKYYSAWYWAAIHMLTGVSGFSTSLKISETLKFPQSFVLKCLKELEDMGLVQSKGKEWKPTKQNINLPKTSPLSPVNHANWRQYAVARMQEEPPENDVHYTAVYTLSKKDCDLVRELAIKVIQDSRKIVEPSKEEEMAVFICDFFKLT